MNALKQLSTIREIILSYEFLSLLNEQEQLASGQLFGFYSRCYD